MRVRKVVTRSGRGFRGKTPSRKCGRVVQWESLLERDAVMLFEFHPDVVSYQEQPSIETYYDDEDLPRRYIPDFSVTFRNGTVIHVEVKPLARLASKKTARKYELVARHYARMGKIFRLLTEAELRREPRYSVLRQLREASKNPLTPTQTASCLRQLGEADRLTLGDAAQRIGKPQVLRMIGIDQLRVDFDKALADEAFVWLKSFKGGSDDSLRI